LDRSAIVLIENFRTKSDEDINFAEINGKPLLRQVTDAVSSIADETLVVVDSDESVEKYRELIGRKVSFVIAEEEPQSELTSALAGFAKAKGKYSLLLPSNAPFVSKDVVLLLFELCINRSAAIPRYPDQQIESLQAVYCTKTALSAAESAHLEGKNDLSSMVEKMQGVRYISTIVIEQLDPDFKSFFRVKTSLDLKKASSMFTGRKRK
jgi:molybdopterin-guanine dinucleotide biosynthesis protein A